MLYLIHVGHEELTYVGGQRRIVHLVLEIEGVVRWADERHVRWAVAHGNAAVAITPFATGNGAFDGLDEAAINAKYWSEPQVKQRKMAEFLVFGAVPWHLVAEIGVADNGVKDEVEASLIGTRPAPRVVVRPTWYY